MKYELMFKGMRLVDEDRDAVRNNTERVLKKYKTMLKGELKDG